jgi:hypothetical protein
MTSPREDAERTGTTNRSGSLFHRRSPVKQPARPAASRGISVSWVVAYGLNDCNNP